MLADEIIAQFEPAKESVDWAKEAIGELRVASQAFFNGHPAEVITELDSQTGEHVQKVRFRTRIPGAIQRKTAEAMANLKNAFDMAAFAARNISSGMSKKSVYYPWARDPTDLGVLLQKRGFDKDLWDTFRAHEPYSRSYAYSGGSDVARALAQLANTKHTYGLAINGNVLSSKHPDISCSGTTVRILGLCWDPKKNETELMRWIGDPKFQGNYEFGFEIVFKDPILSKPVNVIGGLTDFAIKADVVIETLKATCINLRAGISP